MLIRTIIGIGIILLVPITFVAVYLFEKRKKKNTYALFKPGMTIEYYTHKHHGKFRKDILIGAYEIIDTDGPYVWMKNKSNGDECETDLSLDCLYSDMTLKDAEGNIVKTFKFKW